MSHTILVVDDESDVRTMLQQLLILHGYRVLEASDGIEALQILKGEAVSVLLTDVFMWRMDGIELLRQLRKNPKKSPPGIVAMTGVAHLGDSTTAALVATLGAHAVLIKPFSTQQLLDALAAAGAKVGQPIE